MLRPPAWRRWVIEHGVLVVALAFVAVVGVVYGARLTVLADEVFSVDTAGRSMAGTVRQSLRFEMQPPLYFLLLNLWLQVSQAIPWARGLSLLAALLTVLVLDRVARRMGGEEGRGSAARVLPLLGALSPVLIQASSYTRCYAVAVLGIALTLLCFWDVVLSGPVATPRRVAGFVAAAYASIVTFYYTGFVVAAMLLVAFILRPRSRPLWVGGAVLGVLLLPWVPVAARQAAHPILTAPVSHAGGVPAALAWFGLTALDGVLGGVSLLDRRGVPALLAAGLAVLVAGRLASRRTIPWTREETGLVAVAALPALVLAAARYANVLYVDVRHWAPLAVAPLVLIVTVAVRSEPWVRRIGIAGMLVVAAAAATSRLRGLVNWPDARAAVAWMRAQGDRESWPVLVFRGEYARIFRYYVPADRVTALPREASLERFPLEHQVIEDAAEAGRAIAAVVPPGATFWLVQPTRFRSTGGAALDAYGRDSATVLAQRDTALLRVQLLRRAAPTPAARTAGP